MNLNSVMVAKEKAEQNTFRRIAIGGLSPKYFKLKFLIIDLGNCWDNLSFTDLLFWAVSDKWRFNPVPSKVAFARKII